MQPNSNIPSSQIPSHPSSFPSPAAWLFRCAESQKVTPLPSLTDSLTGLNDLLNVNLRMSRHRDQNTLNQSLQPLMLSNILARPSLLTPILLFSTPPDTPSSFSSSYLTLARCLSNFSSLAATLSI